MKKLSSVALLLWLAGSAEAGEVQAALGASAGASTWSADPVGHSVLLVGYRFRDLAAINFVGRLGYGDVDERVISEFSLGGTFYGRIGPTRPNLRLAAVHQHEEPIPSIEADPVGSYFGTGDGIRHRYGGTAQLGIDLPFAVTNQRAQWVISAHAATLVFVDERGPRSYVLGGLTLGVNYDL